MTPDGSEYIKVKYRPPPKQIKRHFSDSFERLREIAEQGKTIESTKNK